jgi:hypothetical protein
MKMIFIYPLHQVEAIVEVGALGAANLLTQQLIGLVYLLEEARE